MLLSDCNKCEWRLADKSGDKSAVVGYTYLCDRKISFSDVQINSYYSHLELQSLICQTQHDSPSLEISLI